MYYNGIDVLNKNKDFIKLSLIAIYYLFNTNEFPYAWPILLAPLGFAVYDRWESAELKNWYCDI